MDKPKAWIFDIDGTLANGSHRQAWLKEKPKNWDAYNAAMHLDKPIQPVIDLLRILAKDSVIILCSGRQDKERKVTEQWFKDYDIPFNFLYMRPTGDFRDDTIIKREIYHNLIKPYYDAIAVFDDRKKVKRMWVQEGLHVFDCNLTDEEF